MPSDSDARESLLSRVLDFAAHDGLADRSLREIATGAGTSHRMLLYHFGSREGLLAAVVEAVEARQRAAMAAMATGSPHEVMTALWAQVSSPQLRPFVRLFFEVFALATRGAPGTARLLDGLTTSWLDEAAGTAARMGLDADRTAMRLGVAVTRGLLLDLVAGAPKEEVDAAYELFARLYGGTPG